MDLTPVLLWWVIITIIGLVGWPAAFSLLRFLPDRGFTMARPAGLLLSAYALWLGGSFRLLQNNIGGIIVAMGLVVILGVVWLRLLPAALGTDRSPLAWLRREWRYALVVEILFSLAFGFWVFYKAHNPAIETAGGEKWMEIAFINGILGSPHFPPQDPWLAGFGISYYYFGYVMMAMLTQLTGIVSTTAFNLYIPTLFAITLTAAFGIGANLVRLNQSTDETAAGQPSIFRLAVVGTGLLSALFVAILGNLIGVLEVLHKRALLPDQFWLWLDIRDLKTPPVGPAEGWIPDRFIWWWRGSRVLTDYNLAGHEQEVIDEFPFFSFLLGDVHPHVLALPFVLLVIALALNLLFSRDHPQRPGDAVTTESAPNLVDKVRQFLENSGRELIMAAGGRLGVLLYAICIGSLSFLNTWDFPIYLGVVTLTMVVRLRLRRYGWGDAVLLGGFGGLLLAVAGVLLYLPFYATFQSQARGLLPNLWNPTRLPQFFVFFGPFLVAVVVLLFVLARQHHGWRQHLGWSMALALLAPPLVLLVVGSGILLNPAGREYLQGILNNPDVQAVIGSASISALLQESLWRRLLNPLTFLFLGGLVGWSLALLAGLCQSEARPRPVTLFVLVLTVAGLGLPLVVEFIYLRDNFGIRMNTIFKFYFQAWVLLALASAYAVYYVSTRLNGIPRLLWQAIMALLVVSGLFYPVLATLNKANYFDDEPTLNGIAWVENSRSDEYEAIEWLRHNTTPSAVILEAPGSGYAAYQYTGRFSALTGRPTLLGWGGHQSQWRGNYEEPARREPDIEMLYSTPDPRVAQMLMDKYDIMYVAVGNLERERYPDSGLTKFDQFMTPVFEAGDVVIYKR
jgi:YYY domain-containing protein